MISTPIFASVSLPEKDALIKLYIATNGSHWKTKWNLEEPDERWFGVKVSDSKVISLDLSNNNLIGELPHELGNMIYLQKLK